MQQQIHTQNQSNAKGMEAKLLYQIEASLPIGYECKENAYRLIDVNTNLTLIGLL